jgi:hypothetical protein
VRDRRKSYVRSLIWATVYVSLPCNNMNKHARAWLLALLCSFGYPYPRVRFFFFLFWLGFLAFNVVFG